MYLETYEKWLRRKYPKQKPIFVFRCQKCYGTGKENQSATVPCRQCNGWGEYPMFDRHNLRANLFFRYVKESQELIEKIKQAKETILE